MTKISKTHHVTKSGKVKRNPIYKYPAEDLEEYFLGKDPRKTKYYKDVKRGKI